VRQTYGGSSTDGEGGSIGTTAQPARGTPAALDGTAFGASVHRAGRPRRGRSWVVSRALALADLGGLSVAFLAAFAFWNHGTPLGSARFALEGVLFVLTIPFWLVFAKTLGLYASDDARADHSTADESLAVVNLVTLGAWVVFVSAWATKLSQPQLPRLISFWALGVTLVIGGRVLVRAIVRRSQAYVQNSVVLGAGHVGQLVARKIQQHPEYGIRLVGFVDENPRARRAEVANLPVLGVSRDLGRLVSDHAIERVIVAFSGKADQRTMELVRSLRDQDVIVDVVPRLYELVGPRADIHLVEGMPLLTIPPARLSRTSLIVKRVMDVSGACLLLLVSAPLFLIAAFRIKRESPGPVFFRQTRLGENMAPFVALKFRTMRVDTDQSEHREYIKNTMTPAATLNANGTYKLSRDDDVTPFGHFLRSTSLDELPQLINVLRGEMSLVGPRPCIEYETEFFQPHHFDRFLVPQGLTGLWQVTARAKSTFGEALEMDVAYVRGWSLGLDLRLLVRTPISLIHQRKSTA
jgi:exopolysaccharide biosynthesis polyprenyl glycosylphosphotransferase